MKAKNMTLGEVLIEFVEAYVEFSFLVRTQKYSARDYTKIFNKMHKLRKELLNQLNHVEIIFKKEN